jgi:hypothetical protein
MLSFPGPGISVCAIDFENKKGTLFFIRSWSGYVAFPTKQDPETGKFNRNVLARSFVMLRTFVEEAAALASIVLFVGMVAIWAEVIPQL